ncbi:MAG: glycosyltransferase family 4 protein [Rhodothermales bacterium]|nr:glycosyltransferase family 4 protein [Rhodothermales bacterium]
MRLLFVTQDFPPALGGIQTYAGELARRFAGWTDDFVVLAPDYPRARELDALLPFDVHRVSSSSDWFPFHAARHAARLARRRRLDTAFCAQWFSALPVVLMHPFGTPKRLFVAVHGREILFEPNRAPGFVRAGYNGLRRRVFAEAERLFPVSGYTGDLLREAGVDAGRITVVNNGTDPALFAPLDPTALRDRLGLNGKVVLLTVCRLVARKGVDTTLRALPGVLHEVPDLIYLVVGDGPDLARLEALAVSLGIESHVRFLAGVDYAAIVQYYNAADVVTMPCRGEPPEVEGFGIVFLEANACEKPVIGTYSGGIPDAVRHGETGLLVEPGDVEALTAGILRLLKDTDLARRLGRQGRERVVKESTWDAVAERIFSQMTTPTRIDTH